MHTTVRKQGLYLLTRSFATSIVQLVIRCASSSVIDEEQRIFAYVQSRAISPRYSTAPERPLFAAAIEFRSWWISKPSGSEER